MERLRTLVVGRWSAAVAATLILLGIALIVLVGQAERTARAVDQLPRGFDSTRAAELAESMPRSDSATAVAVFTARDGGRLDRSQLDRLGSVLAGLDTADVSVAAPRVVPSADGEAAIGVLTVGSVDASEVQDAVTALRASLDDDLPRGLRAEVTGPAAVQADLAAVFDGANVRLLAVTATVVAVLLVLTYRSPLLWLVPLFVVGVADQAAATLATRLLAGVSVPWDESTTGILSVLVFGAGTNYALLLISRYRDELHRHQDRYDAMRLALRRTAEAVVPSAATVVVGVLCLVLSVIPSTRGLGIACAVGIVVAALFALVALPALLVLFGRWIFWPRVPHVDAGVAASGTPFWRRVGDAVARRPATVGGAAILLLAFLALGLLDARLGLPTAEQFLDKPEAIAAGERLAEHFPAGSSDPATLMTRDPEQVRAAVADVEGVDSVRDGRAARGWTELQVVLDDAPDSVAAQDTVGRIRAALDGAGLRGYIGGTAAEAVDLADASTRDRWVIFPVVLVLVMGALVLLLRALLTPVLLVATVVGTYAAALGAGSWIFREILGFSAFDEGVPLFAFLFLVALGVDYNIFLVTRAREEAADHGSREGMLRGLAATGGVITSAGVLLAAVFAVLGVLPLVVLAQLGIVICLGVLLDTLVVRTVLVPALALRLGDRFWWPRRVVDLSS